MSYIVNRIGSSIQKAATVAFFGTETASMSGSFFSLIDTEMITKREIKFGEEVRE
jgi:hypothetical protein